MMEHSLWIGSYTDHDSTKRSYNPGVTRVILDTSSGELNFSESTLKESTIECEQPSYLCRIDDDLLAVSEHCEPNHPALNQLNPITKQTRRRNTLFGDAPCHVAFSQKHQCVAIAHYMGGNISLIDMNAPTAAQVITRHGNGPNLQRQESAHLHQVQFLSQSDQLLAVDLGSDELLLFDLAKNAQQTVHATLEQIIELPEGRGPRHATLNQAEDQLYVLCELSESICHFSLTSDQVWVFKEEYELLLDQPTEEAAAAIRLSDDGKTLYASARAQNKIVSFRIGENGQLHALQVIDCGGEFPRDFALSPCGKWMVIANQNSHSLSVIKIDLATGLMTSTAASLQLGSPVCVLF